MERSLHKNQGEGWAGSKVSIMQSQSACCSQELDQGDKRPIESALNQRGAGRFLDAEEDSSDGAETVFCAVSGFPPPQPYLRRTPTPTKVNAILSRSFGSLTRVNSLPSMEVSGLENSPTIDVFAQRKKMFHSGASVSSQSMPDLRTVRSLYNRGVALELRKEKALLGKSPEKCDKFDDAQYDMLLLDQFDEDEIAH